MLCPAREQRSTLHPHTQEGEDGVRSDALARYSFTYKRVGGEWLIAYHHSRCAECCTAPPLQALGPS